MAKITWPTASSTSRRSVAGREWSVQLYLLVSSVLFKFLPKLIKIVCDLFEVCVTPAVEQRVDTDSHHGHLKI